MFDGIQAVRHAFVSHRFTQKINILCKQHAKLLSYIPIYIYPILVSTRLRFNICDYAFNSSESFVCVCVCGHSELYLVRIRIYDIAQTYGSNTCDAFYCYKRKKTTREKLFATYLQHWILMLFFFSLDSTKNFNDEKYFSHKKYINNRRLQFTIYSENKTSSHFQLTHFDSLTIGIITAVVSIKYE